MPVTVVGVLKERVFRFRKSTSNMFRWRNRIIAVPATARRRGASRATPTTASTG